MSAQKHILKNGRVVTLDGNGKAVGIPVKLGSIVIGPVDDRGGGDECVASIAGFESPKGYGVGPMQALESLLYSLRDEGQAKPPDAQEIADMIRKLRIED